MKKAALINDISGLGKCSLTADISVLTAMGIEACPFPTAVLNAQTGYKCYECRDMTGMMRAYTEGWSALEIKFDGILTGFLLSAAQADEVIHFISVFHTDDSVLLVDPVMADHGKPYANFDEELLERMKNMTERADIITPNVSELCLLAGEDMQETIRLTGTVLEDRICGMAEELLNKENKTVIVTGIPSNVGFSKEKGVGNLIVNKDVKEMILFPETGGSYSGTGDLFAAAVLGGVLNGKTLDESVRTAGEFIMYSVKDAAEREVPANDGTDYEKNLWRVAAL